MANYHELDIQYLALKMLDGDIEAKNIIIEYYTKYIIKIIEVNFNDFEYDKNRIKDEMIKTMYESINTYKYKKNKYFSNYITSKIIQHYSNELRKMYNKKEYKNRDIQKTAIKMLNGDNDSLKQIIEFYTFHILKLVEDKYCNANIEKEDLIQIGIIGLLKAIETYGLNQKYHFCTYANTYIKHEIESELKLINKTSNIEYVGLTNNYNIKAFDDFIENTEVKESIEKLSDMKKKILLLHIYGNYTFEEISDMLGISYQRTHQHYKRALEIIKEQLLINNTNKKNYN